jgi:hypothetical protein
MISEGNKVKKIAFVGMALAGALSLSACQTQQQQQGTLIGGALGAGGGALIGSALSGGSAGGAIAGAVIGGGTGALIGNNVTRPRHCVRWGYTQSGHRVCLAHN